MGNFQKMGLLLVLLAMFFGLAPVSFAGTFSGTIYYTNFAGGGDNVNSVNYTYDDSTNKFKLDSKKGIAAVNGADGIIFAPNGDLLIGGQSNPVVHERTTAGAFVANYSTNQQQNYHLALSPDGKSVYTSNFGGPLVTVSLTGGGTTVSPVKGDDGGVTQLAFAHGNVFYDISNPNGNGNAGLYDLATNTTKRTVKTGAAVHGMIYDPYSDKIVFFGGGYTGSMSAVDGSGYKQFKTTVRDFDQGAVDGLGHAFVAGAGGITLIDYSKSKDITNPDYVKYIGGFENIDDVAPLVGLGSNKTPEPGTLTLLGIGAAGMIGYGWRRRNKEKAVR
jgi:hypothetical protein